MAGNACNLERLYGSALRARPLSEAGSSHLLLKALRGRRPPLNKYSIGVVRQRWRKYGPGKPTALSKLELESPGSVAYDTSEALHVAMGLEL